MNTSSQGVEMASEPKQLSQSGETIKAHGYALPDRYQTAIAKALANRRDAEVADKRNKEATSE